MNRRVGSKTWLIGVLSMSVLSILAGCAVRKVNLWGDPQTGLILTYRMPGKQPLKYQFKAEQSQTIEVMGQSIATESNVAIGFTVQPKGMKENHHQLGLTIDSMKVNVESPQGSLSPDMSTVIGKSFDMIMTELGKELDISGAASIQYDLGPAGKRNIASTFQAFFPDLAGRPVKMGDTWTAEDLIKDETGGGEVRIRLKSEHKLDGFETVDGLECVRIKSAVTGGLEGEGKEQGMDLTFKGDIEGVDTWYFAYKEGLYVKMNSSASIKGTITTSGGQSMTIPLTQKLRMETKLTPANL